VGTTSHLACELFKSMAKVDHEWLFWDNQDFMKQIGLAN